MSKKQNTREAWIVSEKGDSDRMDSADSVETTKEAKEKVPTSGHELLVDIEHVPSLLMQSKGVQTILVTLLQALEWKDVLMEHDNDSGCHNNGSGISCVALTSHGHVFVHSFPQQAVVSLYVLAWEPSSSSLLYLLPVLEDLLGIKDASSTSSTTTNRPHLEWLHKKRGFIPHDVDSQNEDVDRDRWLLGWRGFQNKRLLTRMHTDFQEIEVYEVVNTRFHNVQEIQQGQKDPQSYISQHPDLYRPDKLLYLDKILQSRLYGQVAYHEALVHPTMLAHPHPRRVAILGGGEGATLRECLKWKSVDQVVMVEIDDALVQASRQYLPEWTDCSFLPGSDSDNASCFDQERVQLLTTDAVAYFIDNYLHSPDDTDDKNNNLFDVIVMDAL
jgi:hypothetical protein